MKTLAIDIRFIFHSGIGVYIRNILPSIFRRFRNHKIYLISHSSITFPDWLKEANTTRVNLLTQVYSPFSNLELALKLPREVEVYWSPHYVVPIFFKGKIISTIHDIFHLTPLFEYHFQKYYAHWLIKKTLDKSMAIITVSHFTYGQILKEFGATYEKKMNVIYNGVKSMRPGQVKNREPYLLYVGNVKPHKNLSRLIEAFDSIRNNIPHHLYIIGKKVGFMTEDKSLFRLLKTINNERIHFMGEVNEVELSDYYTNAEFFIFPSLYEGFGLPPLEAMSHGCPVLASNQASIPEVCGEGAIYFNPYDVRDIADKILYLIRNPELRRQLKINGKNQVERYSWEKAGNQTTDIIARLLNDYA